LRQSDLCCSPGPASHTPLQADIACTVEKILHHAAIELPQRVVTVTGQGGMFVGILVQSNLVEVGHEWTRQAGCQRYLRNRLAINTPGDSSLTIVPQEDVQNNLPIASIPVMAVCRPAGGIAVHFNIAPLTSPRSALNDGMQEIRASLGIPPPWCMDNHVLSIQGT
jgi:hypothetical protein